MLCLRPLLPRVSYFHSTTAGSRLAKPSGGSSYSLGPPIPPAAACSFSIDHSNQSSPKSSTGCSARIVPFPERRSSAGQYLSHPQQMRSGCLGWIGKFVTTLNSEVVAAMLNPGNPESLLIRGYKTWNSRAVTQVTRFALERGDTLAPGADSEVLAVPRPAKPLISTV